MRKKKAIFFSFVVDNDGTFLTASFFLSSLLELSSSLSSCISPFLVVAKYLLSLAPLPAKFETMDETLAMAPLSASAAIS